MNDPECKEYKIPRECSSWYDGCNTCGVDQNLGQATMCTMMFCDEPALPECRAFAPPPGCRSWFDGCNTCSITNDGKVDACTEMACFTMNQPICRGYGPPAGCTNWFDGCNNCSVMADGGLACTRMACREKGEAYCTAFSDDRKASFLN